MNSPCFGLSARFKVRCDNPPTHIVTAGCIHEHIITAKVCDTHRDMALEQNMACGRCYKGHESHVCYMAGRVTS